MIEDIYVLAHEMKNPLCVARGYLEMLNEKNWNDYKEIIQKEIDNSLEILDDYLECGKLSLQKEEMDLNILLLDVKNKLNEFLKKKNIHLAIELRDEDIYLQGDYPKLMQVFYNIIKNSCEWQARKITINYQIIDDKVKIEIINDGLPIPSEDLSKVGKNYSNRILGNGIGTTLSKKIIEMHGGKIKYLNDDGVKVIITLPLS